MKGILRHRYRTDSKGKPATLTTSVRDLRAQLTAKSSELEALKSRIARGEIAEGEDAGARKRELEDDILILRGKHQKAVGELRDAEREEAATMVHQAFNDLVESYLAFDNHARKVAAAAEVCSIAGRTLAEVNATVDDNSKALRNPVDMALEAIGEGTIEIVMRDGRTKKANRTDFINPATFFVDCHYPESGLAQVIEAMKSVKPETRDAVERRASEIAEQSIRTSELMQPIG